jgi:hypothetical protein
MSDTPVNLNRARKARARQEAKAAADANAVKFGRSKADRALDSARNVKARATLDAHRLDAHRRDDGGRDGE